MNGTFLIHLGGAIMALSVVLGLISAAVFRITGKRIRRELEKKYGEPWKYNI